MKVLVTGGAGYIGSHMVWRLIEGGHAAVVFDNLENGYRDAVAVAATLIEGNLADGRRLLEALAGCDAVMHFASYIQVGESVAKPGKYYRNNLANSLNLLDAMVTSGVDKLIFSSSAAIFGNPQYVPIDEGHPNKPINPYGRSKLMVEEALADYGRAHGIRSVALRYFNAAGAAADGTLGERHDPETHLIPLLLQAAAGRVVHVDIFGDDYDTPDGTCIRDYVHVEDLCDAHLLALESLAAGGASGAFNLGNGRGFSVLEVIAAVERVTGLKVPTRIAPRRAGDPARLVADSATAMQVLGWRPRRADIEVIIADAWRWEQRQAAGGRA